MPFNLEVNWPQNSDIEGTDVFPLDWFGPHRQTLRALEHEGYGPSRKRWAAICDLTLGDRSADLNYSAYRDENTRRDMHLGVARIEFVDIDRTQVYQAMWRFEGQRRFSITAAETRLVSVDIKSYRRKTSESPTEMVSRKSRLGQVSFRRELKAAYGSKCCISGCNVSEALDAAHIDKHAGPASNHVQNGLLLRRDLHALFDAGLMAIDPKTMTTAFAMEVRGWKEYQRWHGTQKLATPDKGSTYSPSVQALRRRWASFQRH
jgi:hypothetical protein